MSKESSASGGVSGMFLLFLLFLGLKLTGHIAWSWWCVTAPLWGPLLFALFFLAIAGLLLLAAKLMRSQKKAQ
jgi:hypothetical protein